MAVRFDASGDSLSKTVISSGAYTAMGWFKISVDRNNYSVFIQLHGNQVIETNADGTTLMLWTGAEHVGSALTVGVWYHLAITASNVVSGSGTTKMYLNGVLDATGAGHSDASGSMYFGNDQFSEFLNGCAAYCKAWTAELTAAEILQEMNVIRPVRTANLAGWWPMFANTTERARDYSGLGSNLTENGTLTDESPPGVRWGAALIAMPFASTGGSTNLTVQEATHTHAVDAIALSADSALAVTDATHAHAADVITLTTLSVLTVTDATHTHAVDAINLTLASSLVVQDAEHVHGSDVVALTANSALAVTDATHTHSTDAITLTASAYLSVTDATHTHAADAIALTSVSTLTVQDATHEHATDGIALSVNGSITLTVSDATHVHAVDAIALTANAYLTVDDVAHAHSVDAITLTLTYNLAMQDAEHVHGSDVIAMSATSYLTVQDASHTHTVDAITFFETVTRIISVNARAFETMSVNSSVRENVSVNSTVRTLVQVDSEDVP